MKYLTTFLICLLELAPLFAQEFHQELESFEKLVVSPKIDVKLSAGDKEEILVIYEGIEKHHINIEVTGKTLHLFLDNARYFDLTEEIHENQNQESHCAFSQKNANYENAHVTAYITYKWLEYIEIRGDQSLTCFSSLEATDLTIKGYGENKIALALINAENLRVVLAGENKLYIKSGTARFQKYRLYGENEVDAKKVVATTTVTNVYGNNKLKIFTEENLKINTFGDSEIIYSGDPNIKKQIMVGDTKVFPFKKL